MVVKFATKPKAKEQLVVILMILAVVEFILFDFVKFAKFGSRFGAGVDNLGVDLVEHFGKGSIFRLNTTTIR